MQGVTLYAILGYLFCFGVANAFVVAYGFGQIHKALRRRRTSQALLGAAILAGGLLMVFLVLAAMVPITSYVGR